MSDYYTYRNVKNSKRRTRLFIIIAIILLVAALGVAGFLYFRSKAAPLREQPMPVEAMTVSAEAPEETAEEAVEPETTPEPQPENFAAAAGPVRLFAAVDDIAWNTKEPVEQTIDLEYFNTDYRMAALPMLGTVTSNYFSTVTFVGDSITSGLGIYDAGIPNATYAAYIGAGPNSFVNNVSMQNAVTKVSETPLEVIEASQPDYVYIMLGTNSLVSTGNEESFIAYYERLIDILRERLNPGVVYYIQSIPAVQEWVAQNKPGLENGRINTVNNLIANMALRKGCYFVNPCECLNDLDGSQKDEYQTKDGIHLQPSGYRAWSDYLSTHTAWNRRSLYTGENPYYIFGS